VNDLGELLALVDDDLLLRRSGDHFGEPLGLRRQRPQRCRVQQIDRKLMRAPRGLAGAAWAKQEEMLAAGVEESRYKCRYESRNGS